MMKLLSPERIAGNCLHDYISFDLRSLYHRSNSSRYSRISDVRSVRLGACLSIDSAQHLSYSIRIMDMRRGRVAIAKRENQSEKKLSPSFFLFYLDLF